MDLIETGLLIPYRNSRGVLRIIIKMHFKQLVTVAPVVNLKTVSSNTVVAVEIQCYVVTVDRKSRPSTMFTLTEKKSNFNSS